MADELNNRLATSHVVPQLQLRRVRVWIELLFQIRLIEPSHIVVRERDRNDQGDEAPVILSDHRRQPLLFVRREVLLEIAHNVLEHN